MANTQILKRRIRSISNTRQITKAMELVSAAKMRRVVDAAARSRVYSEAVVSVLRRLSGSIEAGHHPYFRPAAGKNKLYVIFTSDSGLAGAYNSSIFNFTARQLEIDARTGHKSRLIVFGRRGARHFSRGTNINLVGEYEGVADDPPMDVFAPVIETIDKEVKNGDLAAVDLIYTEFLSTMNQKPRLLQLIPVAPEAGTTDGSEPVFEFEPNAGEVLDTALRLYLESSLRRVRLEAAASEHAMRMLSMNNANRNAGNLIDNLTLELNATRQAAITQEMAEIIGGADAIA